jgi:hypothetical protein
VAGVIPDHMREPMMLGEWQFVQLLLSQADDAASWWELRTGQAVNPTVSTPHTRRLVARGAHGQLLSKPQLTLIGVQLRLGARYCGHDLNPEAFHFWEAGDERDALNYALDVWNGEPEAFLPGHMCGLASTWMHYYADKLLLLGAP